MSESNGLLLHLKMDQIVEDNGGNKIIPDISGNSHHGTIPSYSCLKIVSDGAFSNCLNFEENCVNYVALPVAAFPKGNEITISFWAKGDNSLPKNTSVVSAESKSTEEESSMCAIALPWGDGNIDFLCGRASSDYDRIEKFDKDSNFKGKWVHWAFTKNATTGEMKIYLNGTLWLSEQNKKEPVPAVSSFSLGPLHTEYYYGKIASFRVYNKALSVEEIIAQDDYLARLIPITDNNSTFAVNLIQQGLHSVFQITAIPKPKFIQRYKNIFGNNESIAKQAYDNALVRKTALMLHHVSLLDHTGAHYRNALFNNVALQTDDIYGHLPTYQALFGGLDFCTCEHCRSIYSPAAYLVDLWHLKQNTITVEVDKKDAFSLENRRPDLEQVLLNCENTNTLIPKLDIVNRILEDRVFKKLVDELKEKSWVSLLEDVKFKRLMSYTGQFDVLFSNPHFKVVYNNPLFYEFFSQHQAALIKKEFEITDEQFKDSLLTKDNDFVELLKNNLFREVVINTPQFEPLLLSRYFEEVIAHPSFKVFHQLMQEATFQKLFKNSDFRKLLSDSDFVKLLRFAPLKSWYQKQNAEDEQETVTSFGNWLRSKNFTKLGRIVDSFWENIVELPETVEEFLEKLDIESLEQNVIEDDSQDGSFNADYLNDLLFKNSDFKTFLLESNIDELRKGNDFYQFFNNGSFRTLLRDSDYFYTIIAIEGENKAIPNQQFWELYEHYSSGKGAHGNIVDDIQTDIAALPIAAKLQQIEPLTQDERLVIESKVFEFLSENQSTLALPFNLPLSQVRDYLSHLKTDLPAIWQVFQVKEDQEDILSSQSAREMLSISPQEYALYTD